MVGKPKQQLTRIETKMMECEDKLEQVSGIMQNCVAQATSCMNSFDVAKGIHEDLVRTHEGLRLLNDIRLGEVHVIDKYGHPAHITLA